MEYNNDLEIKEDAAPASTDNTSAEPLNNEEDLKAELARKEEELRKAQYTIQKHKEANKEISNKPTDMDAIRQAVADIKKKEDEEVATQELIAGLASIQDDAKRAEVEDLLSASIKYDASSPASVRDALDKAKRLASVETISRENAELKRSAVAKRSITSDSMGSSVKKMDSTEGYSDIFSPEQLAEISAKGLDPADVLKVHQGREKGEFVPNWVEPSSRI